MAAGKPLSLQLLPPRVCWDHITVVPKLVACRYLWDKREQAQNFQMQKCTADAAGHQPESQRRGQWNEMLVAHMGALKRSHTLWRPASPLCLPARLVRAGKAVAVKPSSKSSALRQRKWEILGRSWCFCFPQLPTRMNLFSSHSSPHQQNSNTHTGCIIWCVFRVTLLVQLSQKQSKFTLTKTSLQYKTTLLVIRDACDFALTCTFTAKFAMFWVWQGNYSRILVPTRRTPSWFSL